MKKLLLTLLTAICITALNSCLSVKTVSNKITIASGQIPPDMAKEKFTIIGMLKGRNSYDKYLQKDFQEYYTGDYVLATDKDMGNYSDVNKYRYVLDYDFSSNVYFQGNGSQTRTYTYTYAIYDRKENKYYKRKMGSGFFSKEIQAYLLAIDRERKK